MPESENRPDVKEYLKTQRIIYASLLGGCILFASVVIILVGAIEQSLVDELTSGVLVGVALLVAIGVPLWGHSAFRREVEAIPEEAPLQEKLDAYNSASILRWGSFEGALILCLLAALVAAQLTYALVPLAAAAGVFVVFAMTGPTQQRLLDTLPLSKEEEQIIRYGRRFAS